MFTGKFRVVSRKHYGWSPTLVEYELAAVTGGTPENDAYHKFTPNGHLMIQVDNPDVHAQLAVNKVFKLTFNEVPE